MTPLVPLAFGGAEILCKLDFLFPTGSFKDRGATVLMSKMKEWGLEQILMDSSGNAAAAVAAYAARAGIECDIYAPASTSAAKCAQITAYGANLHKIPGPRAASTAVAVEAAKERFYASHFWNPWFNHGTKTWAFEVWEQLGLKTPDAVVAPPGTARPCSARIWGSWNSSGRATSTSYLKSSRPRRRGARRWCGCGRKTSEPSPR